MIKLIFIALFCCSAIAGVVEEKKEGKKKFQLVIDIDGDDCCDCDCKDKEDEENLCLNTENSKKISEAIINVIHNNDYSYEVIDDLKIAEFMSGDLSYSAFARNIRKHKEFEYEGFKLLRHLVKKYKVCEKVCKVYSELRKALRENTANAKVTVTEDEEGLLEIQVNGPMIILSDVCPEIEKMLNADASYISVTFKANTFIIDESLMNESWHSIVVNVEATTAIISADIVWNVTGINGEPNGWFTLDIGAYDQGAHSFTLKPEP